MDIKDLIDMEAAASEASRDAPEPRQVAGVRKKGGTVLSVRLNHDEMAELITLAQARHIPTSTMARSLILQAMSGTTPAPTALEEALAAALRRTAAPEFLAKRAG